MGSKFNTEQSYFSKNNDQKKDFWEVRFIQLNFFLLIFLTGVLVFGNTSTLNTSDMKVSKEKTSTQKAIKTKLFKDFDSLGGNKDLFDNLNAMETSGKTKLSLVQNRTVDRVARSEFALNYQSDFQGGTYLNTQGVGVGYYYHFNPRVSVSINTNYYFNNLTSEGQSLLDVGRQAQADDPFVSFIPSIDYPKSNYSVGLEWYPMYGKFNLLNQAITQFDLYTLMDLGQIQTLRTKSFYLAYGVGVGLWLSQKLSVRLEAVLQSYDVSGFESLNNRTRTKKVSSGSVSVGYML